MTERATITADAILPDMLLVTARMWIWRLRELDDATFDATFREWTDEAWAEANGVFSEDVLLLSRKKGDTARAFNALAKMIAALSFVPGGVTVFNTHYEATREKDAPDA